jgi:hypothetical protein
MVYKQTEITTKKLQMHLQIYFIYFLTNLLMFSINYNYTCIKRLSRQHILVKIILMLVNKKKGKS